MSFGRIVIPEDSKWSDDIDALRARLNKNERVSFVRRRVGRVGHCKNDVNGITGITGT